MVVKGDAAVAWTYSDERALLMETVSFELRPLCQRSQLLGMTGRGISGAK